MFNNENVKDGIIEILSDWNLDISKLVAITTDSASNMKRACSLLYLSRLSCFGHNLDLAVQKACDDSRITRVLRVCHQIVAKFSQNWKKKRDLATAQHEKQLPSHKLKADCPTIMVLSILRTVRTDGGRIQKIGTEISARLTPILRTSQDINMLKCGPRCISNRIPHIEADTSVEYSSNTLFS